MPDESHNSLAEESTVNDLNNSDDGGEAAETAIPIGDRRRRADANAADGSQEQGPLRGLRQGFSLPSTANELHCAKERWDEDSWQLKALHFINSDKVQKFFIYLLVLDVLILFTELAIDVFFPACVTVIRDAISCCPADGYSDGHDAHADDTDVHRLLGGGDGSEICTYPLVQTTYPAGCDSHKYHGVHVTHDVLFWCTVAILVAFEIELVLLMYLLGMKQFFHHYIYVVDLFIVTISLVLELIFKLAKNSVMEVLPGILIIFRLWRFVRIGHGLVASTYELQDHKMELALEHIEELENRLRAHENNLPQRHKLLRKETRDFNRSTK